MEVLSSSRRHGIDDEDIQHAIEQALVIEEVAEDPVRYLLLGPDRAGNPLELVVLDRPQGPARDPRDEDAGEVPSPLTRERMRCQETTGS